MPQRAVPTLAELEARIDEALVIARASEEGVGMVGEVALDAARQARRAAEAAEASARTVAAAVETASLPVVEPSGPGPAVSDPPGPVASREPPSPSVRPPEAVPPVGGGVEERPSTREVVIDPLQRFNKRADAVAARLTKLTQLPG